MDETCSSQSGFQRLGTSHSEVWIKHIHPYGDLQKSLQFPVFLFFLLFLLFFFVYLYFMVTGAAS